MGGGYCCPASRERKPGGASQWSQQGLPAAPRSCVLSAGDTQGPPYCRPRVSPEPSSPKPSLDSFYSLKRIHFVAQGGKMESQLPLPVLVRHRERAAAGDPGRPTPTQPSCHLRCVGILPPVLNLEAFALRPASQFRLLPSPGGRPPWGRAGPQPPSLPFTRVTLTEPPTPLLLMRGGPAGWPERSMVPSIVMSQTDSTSLPAAASRCVSGSVFCAITYLITSVLLTRLITLMFNSWDS